MHYLEIAFTHFIYITNNHQFQIEKKPARPIYPEYEIARDEGRLRWWYALRIEPLW